MLAALLVPVGGRRADRAVPARCPNLREGVTLVTAGAAAAVRRSRCCPPFSTAARPAFTLSRGAAGPAPGLRGRAAGHAVRADRLGPVDRQLALLDRLHARQRRGTGRRASTSASRWRWRRRWASRSPRNLFTLFVFYEVLTLVTYPLVTHHGTDEARRGGRIYLGAAARHVDRVPAAGAGHSPGSSPAPPTSRRAAFWPASSARAALGRPARAVHVRHRQGGADAVSSLAAGGDGRADAGVGAAARGGGGQGRRVQRRQGHRLRVRHRHARRAPASPAGWSRVAGFTIVAASVVALKADNLKRRLAYSTVSQLSYVVLAAALLAPLVGRSARSCTSPRMRSARSRCSSLPARSTPPRTRRRSASSTASAGACPGPWARSRSARCR